ncbi:MAG: hypothetical protein PUG71_07135 [bacterium]|nr:hypothetical protein [bacterium]
MITNTTCNQQVDYSSIPGDRILPFVFTLNLDDSILYPSEGEYQKFCYDIIGVGQDTSQYADLSHFLLDICSTITQNDISEITVSINGDPQTIVWGENVEIKTEAIPDNPTGCTGLKLDFPLDKVIGVMQVCISLRTPYPIGPVNVCLYGGGTTASGLAICGPSCGENEPCESVFYQKETVCVPVKVTPFAKPGTAKATCCGEPVINSGTQCSGTQASCSFTITQSLCIEIPISFGAVIETGTAVVQCGTVSETVCDCSDTASERTTSTQRNEEARDRRFFNR